jgi:hypothetical protein
MAAFCGCCGAEITGKDEACLVCGTPRHGMGRPDALSPLDLAAEAAPPPQDAAGLGDER